MHYPVVIHKDRDSCYGVTVPDLPGCFSAGDTFEEAMVNVQEAIQCHLEGMLMDGDPIPAQRPIEEHQANPDYAGGVWALVDFDMSRLRSKTVRVNITLPERVLAIIDEQAKRAGETRSGYLTQMALMTKPSDSVTVKGQRPTIVRKRAAKKRRVA
jgi:predicted RNase H-like HicB family nuclease